MVNDRCHEETGDGDVLARRGSGTVARAVTIIDCDSQPAQLAAIGITIGATTRYLTKESH